MVNFTKLKLGQITEIQTGPFGSQLHNDDYVSNGTPIVTVEHLGNKYFTTQNLPLVSEEDKNRLYKYILKENDIVFSRVGSVDRCSIVSINEDGWLFSGRCLRVRPNAKYINPQWLYYYFTQNYFKQYVRNKAVGCTMPSLNTELLSELNISFPDLSTQKKIADVLSSIDDKIALNNKTNTELENMAKTIYDYWFTQFDFPDKNDHPYKSSGGQMVYNEILKREIPAGWEGLKLEKCLSRIATGLNPRDNFVLGNGNIKYLTVKNLNTDGTIDFSNCDLIDEEALKLVHARSDIKKGDILFASIAPLGRCYLIQDTPKGWDINESVFSIRPNTDLISSIYLYMFFMDESFVKLAQSNSTGSVFKGIRINDLYSIPILVPEKQIMEKFSEIITPIMNMKYRVEKENKELVELRDYLLPLLMNGQINIGA